MTCLSGRLLKFWAILGYLNNAGCTEILGRQYHADPRRDHHFVNCPCLTVRPRDESLMSFEKTSRVF